METESKFIIVGGDRKIPFTSIRSYCVKPHELCKRVKHQKSILDSILTGITTLSFFILGETGIYFPPDEVENTVPSQVLIVRTWNGIEHRFYETDLNFDFKKTVGELNSHFKRGEN